MKRDSNFIDEPLTIDNFQKYYNQCTYNNSEDSNIGQWQQEIIIIDRIDDENIFGQMQHETFISNSNTSFIVMPISKHMLIEKVVYCTTMRHSLYLKVLLHQYKLQTAHNSNIENNNKSGLLNGIVFYVNNEYIVLTLNIEYVLNLNSSKHIATITDQLKSLKKSLFLTGFSQCQDCIIVDGEIVMSEKNDNKILTFSIKYDKKFTKEIANNIN